jgi:hypothetical protein
MEPFRKSQEGGLDIKPYDSLQVEPTGAPPIADSPNSTTRPNPSATGVNRKLASSDHSHSPLSSHDDSYGFGTPLSVSESEVFPSPGDTAYYSKSSVGSETQLLSTKQHVTSTVTAVSDEHLSWNHGPPKQRYFPRIPGLYMYIYLILGVVGALSHHFFYASLVGHEAKDQLKMLRYGGVLSFVSKASLLSAIMVAYRQQIWNTFRRKSMTVSAIDSLFDAMQEASALLSLEALRKAKVAMFLAGIFWLTPLVAILAPATLTVEPATVVNQTMCSSVRTLNFTAESSNNWRTPHRIRSLPELSLSFWNVTSMNTSDPNLFDYYTAPSSPAQQVATMSAYLKRAVTMETISVDTCGAGWNCSYTITFEGPGYKCADIVDDSKIRKRGAPFNKTSILPNGTLSYIAHTSLGEYSTEQMNASSGGVPYDSPPFPPHLGAFRTEPVLWIGYAKATDPNKPLPANSSMPGWSTAFSPHMFFCEHFVTRYTVLFNFTSGIQRTSVTNREFIRPIIDTHLLADVDANDGTKDNITATPASNYIYPQDVERYRLTAAYHSLGLLMRNFINGTISMASGADAPIANTEALKTSLIDPRTYLSAPNLMDKVQSFYEDIIISLLSNPQFLAVAWASDPTQFSGTGLANGTVGEYPCTKTRVISAFMYHSAQLWAIYSSIILLAGISVVLGAAAIAQNSGVVRNAHFSSIVAATRSRDMDVVGWTKGPRSQLGEVSRDVVKTRLEYGVVYAGLDVNGEQVVEYGFGVDGSVKRSVAASTAGSVVSFQRWDD